MLLPVGALPMVIAGVVVQAISVLAVVKATARGMNRNAVMTDSCSGWERLKGREESMRERCLLSAVRGHQLASRRIRARTAQLSPQRSADASLRWQWPAKSSNAESV